MKYQYFVCDVFTETRFGGNPLAVLPNAEGLTSEQMQAIAKEFNLSESSFVFPAENGNTRKVRIFTPATEVPFAGHPNVGTAFTLASIGEFGELSDMIEIVFEEQAGLVGITIRNEPGKAIWAELKAPEKLSLGSEVPVELVADALCLNQSDIKTTTHQPKVASVGLAFLIVEVVSQSALEKAQINVGALNSIVDLGVNPYIHFYFKSDDDFDIHTRMFAPLDGVPEDPATGSANCALAGLLCHHAEQSEGDFSWRISQGVEMGRPSILDARATKNSGQVDNVWIAGRCVMVAQGTIEVD